MCAIGRDQSTSIGANAPATAMLGAPAIGGSPSVVGRTTLLTRPAVPRAAAAANGTILAPKTKTPPRKLDLMEP